MAEITNINPLRVWVQHVLPLVYDDSLSYYELLCKVTDKINQLINNNNVLPEYIEQVVASQVKAFFETEEGINLLSPFVSEINVNDPPFGLTAVDNSGNTDQHDNIIAIYNFAREHHIDVYFPAGNYLTSPLSLTANVNIRGDKDKTTIFGIENNSDYVVSLNNYHGTITDIAINANVKSQVNKPSCVYADAASSPVFINSSFSNGDVLIFNAGYFVCHGCHFTMPVSGIIVDSQSATTKCFNCDFSSGLINVNSRRVNLVNCSCDPATKINITGDNGLFVLTSGVYDNIVDTGNGNQIIISGSAAKVSGQKADISINNVVIAANNVNSTVDSNVSHCTTENKEVTKTAEYTLPDTTVTAKNVTTSISGAKSETVTGSKTVISGSLNDTTGERTIQSGSVTDKTTGKRTIESGMQEITATDSTEINLKNTHVTTEDVVIETPSAVITVIGQETEVDTTAGSLTINGDIVTVNGRDIITASDNIDLIADNYKMFTPNTPLTAPFVTANITTTDGAKHKLLLDSASGANTWANSVDYSIQSMQADIEDLQQGGGGTGFNPSVINMYSKPENVKIDGSGIGAEVVSNQLTLSKGVYVIFLATPIRTGAMGNTYSLALTQAGSTKRYYFYAPKVSTVSTYPDPGCYIGSCVFNITSNSTLVIEATGDATGDVTIPANSPMGQILKLT